MTRFALLFPLALMACTPDDPAPVPTPAPKPQPPANQTAACNPADFQSLVGKPFVDGSVTYEGRVRVIPFGAAVTMDFLPNRLNIDLSQERTVTRVFCG